MESLLVLFPLIVLVLLVEISYDWKCTRAMYHLVFKFLKKEK